MSKQDNEEISDGAAATERNEFEIFPLNGKVHVLGSL